MGKAKGDHTPEPLPLDDARWVLITTLVKERLIERSGSGDDAVRDLEQAMAQQGLRCMARSKDTGERKMLPPTIWEEITITWRGPQYGVIAEYRRRPGDHTWRQFMYRLFVWLPDLDRIWPLAVSAPVDQGNVSDVTPQRVKPGPKPKGDWPTLLARWLIAVAAEGPKRLQNVDALVTDAQDFLDNQIEWAPKDNKVLRAKIVELLQDVRH